MHNARGVPRFKADQVARHEGGAHGLVRGELEVRVNLQGQAGRRTIVGKHWNRGDIANTYARAVWLQVGGLLRVLCAGWDDGYSRLSGIRAIGDDVVEGDRALQATGGSNAQQMAIDQSHFQAEICRDFNSLDDQHTARGI